MRNGMDNCYVYLSCLDYSITVLPVFRPTERARSMKQNVNILIVALLVPAGTLLAQESKLENPLPGKKANAAFEKSDEFGPTTLQVSTNDGTSLLHQQLRKQNVENARWTNDGNYLVMTGRNSEGHSPWRYIVTVFSVADREVRRMDDSDDISRPPCISSEIWCQGPDTVALIARSLRQNIPASGDPDPIIVKYVLSKTWPRLKKLLPP